MSRRRAVGHVMLDVGVRSETFVAHAIEAVTREGWESHVIGMNRSGGFTEVPAGRVHCTGPGSLWQRAQTRLRGSTPEQRFAQMALRRAHEWRLDLLHAHFGWSAAYAAPLARMLQVPLVVTFYGTDATEPHRSYRSVFDQAAQVIAVSEFVERHLRAIGYSGPVRLIRNGLPLGELTPQLTPPSPAQAVRMLFIGRLVPVKGADVLIRAMPAILDEVPAARLEIIGDGPERRSLEPMVGDLGVGASVTFSGMLPHSRVMTALRSAHVLIVPGRTMPSGQAETSSMVFKEALAVGVPVVATASGALPETCPPAYRGELAAPGDPAKLAQAVLGMLHDPGSWDERARTGRSWVTEQFGLEKLGEGLSRAYEQALVGRRDAGAASGAGRGVRPTALSNSSRRSAQASGLRRLSEAR